MSFVFNACEVFEMAEKIERNGADFYRAIAERFSDSQTRGTLLKLADWEQQHAEGFAGIRRELASGECPASTIDPDHEDALYLKALADEHVFKVRDDPRKRLTGGEGREEILRMAINLDKEAMAFYLGLKQAVSRASDRELVDVVIKAKMRHIGILNRELDGLL